MRPLACRSLILLVCGVSAGLAVWLQAGLSRRWLDWWPYVLLTATLMGITYELLRH